MYSYLLFVSYLGKASQQNMSFMEGDRKFNDFKCITLRRIIAPEK